MSEARTKIDEGRSLNGGNITVSHSTTSHLQVVDTAPDDALTDVRGAISSPVPPDAQPLRSSTNSSRRIGYQRSLTLTQSFVSRVLLAWLPTYAVMRVLSYDVATAAINAIVLTLIYAPTSQWVLQRTRALPLAYGPVSALAASSIIGYVFGTAVAFTFPELVHSTLVLAISATFAAAAATCWYAIVVSPFGATQRVIVVGGGNDVLRLTQDASQERRRFAIVAIVADDPSPEVAALPLLRGPTSELGVAIRELSPDLVVIAVHRGRPEIFRRLLDVASTDFSMLGLPEFYELAFGRLPIRELTPAWFMSTLHVYTRPYNRFSKRAFDLGVASIGLLLALPLLPFVALMVLRTPGPLLYRQNRLGEHGELFTILKFRTMSADAEGSSGAVWAETHDPRIIPGGKLLRRTRIDELPQLWNVLKGDMSIVGPRPERPEFIQALEIAVPFWQQRELLRPGITGWAQIRAGYAADEMGAERKLSYDLWYLRHRSLTLDAVICARTIGTLISGDGAR